MSQVASLSAWQRGAKGQPCCGKLCDKSPRMIISSPCKSGIRVGNGGDQRLRIRVFRLFKDDFGLGDFDNFAEVEQRDSSAHIAHDAEVMRDKQISQVELVLQVLQQVENLRLHETSSAEVGSGQHNQARLHGQARRGRCDALLLPAAELMRIAIIVFLFESHHVHQLQHTLPPLIAFRLSCIQSGSPMICRRSCGR